MTTEPTTPAGSDLPTSPAAAPSASSASNAAQNAFNNLTNSSVTPSRLVAGLLGIFLGSLGIHRFYLGFTKIGVIQIIVTVVTLGAGGIWGFVEGILILIRHEKFRTDAQGRQLRD